MDLSFLSNGLDLSVLIKLIIAAVLGAFIGVEREKMQQKLKIVNFGGIRTFTFISILGFTSSYLIPNINNFFPLVVFFAIFGLIFVNYFHSSKKLEVERGITTEIAAMLTYIIGCLSFFHFKIAIIVCILTALLLSLKTELHRFVKNIKDEEFLATVEFAIFAFIVLPIIPNYTIDPWGVFNPYEIWLLILFILAVNFIGYIFAKVVGEDKGILFTALIGGLVSSTAVTQSMSEKSKQNEVSYRIFSVATVTASLIMFIRILIIVEIFNRELVKYIIVPIGAMLFSTIIQIIFNLYMMKKEQNGHNIASINSIKESPFKIVPALKFGFFFVIIIFVIAFAKNYLGSKGIYLAALISGVVDVDVFTLSMIKLSLNDVAFISNASKAIVLVAMSNIFFKAGIAFLFGARNFAKSVMINFAIIIAVGLITLLFV
jgi:uncharacterized membrane protein (DUF4010 family)